MSHSKSLLVALVFVVIAMIKPSDCFKVTSLQSFNGPPLRDSSVVSLRMRAVDVQPSLRRRALLQGLLLAPLCAKVQDAAAAVSNDDFFQRLSNASEEPAFDLDKFVEKLPSARKFVRRDSDAGVEDLKAASDADRAETMGLEIPQGYESVWRPGRETYVYPAEYADRIRSR
eukprot:CAMPEP_0196740548 /NCGR_PEP_ID=MMETSP1091-20130531/33421_1 /TAXON_ID=302021 /ORGANISM="Rhodomonas sp., Strain CCMP768" /LENGTH=171 /DNA_ID=CAMNT_0042085761 /DNA_START=49 /DNA_END=564 /DNA_ORIENTATION=+